MPQVEARRDQFLLEVRQQLGIARRVVRAGCRPARGRCRGPAARTRCGSTSRARTRDSSGAISQSANTSRGSWPGSDARRRAVRERRRGVRPRPGQRLVRIEEDDLLLPLRRSACSRSARRTPPCRPAAPRGQSSARTPMKRQGDRRRDGVRLLALHGAVEVHRRHAEVAAARREQLAHEPVVGHVVAEARPDPAVVGLHRVRPEVDRELRLHAQQVAPPHRPVVGELRRARAGGRSSAARLSGLRSSRNARASSAVGSVPITSRYTRRRNTASERQRRRLEVQLSSASRRPVRRSGSRTSGVPACSNGAAGPAAPRPRSGWLRPRRGW